MLSYQLFEKASDIRLYKPGSRDREEFDKIKAKLHFIRDLDLIVFCAAIGIRSVKLLNGAEKEPAPSLTKLVSIISLDTASLYDFIVLVYLETSEQRMTEFESYFHTGFRVLKDWFNKNDKLMTNSLERLCVLYDDFVSGPAAKGKEKPQTHERSKIG